MPQSTIKAPVSCRGVGLHTGISSYIEFRPAPAGSGIYFVSPGGEKLCATALNISKTSRGTTLGSISTVEHVLAAIYGLNIDNIEIYIEGAEPPAMDGSCIEFVKLLKSSGIIELKGDRKFIKISAPLMVGDDDSYIKVAPLDRLCVSAFIDYEKSFVGKQTAIYDEAINDFEKDIAPARTFGLVSELESLKSAGLARGASEKNAVGILDKSFTSPLRFPNELARHKILDIMGDMTLVGAKIVGMIESHKAGHKLNVELARRLING